MSQYEFFNALNTTFASSFPNMFVCTIDNTILYVKIWIKWYYNEHNF